VLIKQAGEGNFLGLSIFMCDYYAKNGKRSELFDALFQKYGEAIAISSYVYSQTPVFRREYIGPRDANREPTLVGMENGGHISKAPILMKEAEQLENFVYRAEKLKEAFKVAGINIIIRENKSLDSTAVLLNEAGQSVIEYNPDKIRTDSVYHEHGHLLVDLIGYETDLIQRGVNQIAGTALYQSIQLLHPELSQEMLNKEVLTTLIGQRAEEMKDKGVKFWVNRVLRKLSELFGIEIDVAEKLADQLVSGNVQKVLRGKRTLQAQHQKDLRKISTVFTKKSEILERAIITVEGKLRDYFGNIPEAERSINPLFKDFKAVSDLLQEKRKADINAGLVEFLAFAYVQTQDLEKQIDNILFSTRNGARPQIKAKVLRDLLNYNESFGDIIADIEYAINGDITLKKAAEDALIDKDLHQYLNEIKKRYDKVYREGKKIGLEYLADRMLATDENNKFVEHLKNRLKRQWTELPGNKERLKTDTKAANKDRNEWANSEIARLKDWQGQGDRSILSELTREYYLNLLEQSPGDISWLSRMFLAGNMINDEVIQLGAEMLDRADFATRQAYLKEYSKAADLFDRFDKVKPHLDQREKYKEMIEEAVELDDTGKVVKTGKQSQYMVGKYYSAFYDLNKEFKKALQILKEEKGEDSAEFVALQDKYLKFLDDNTVRPYNDEYYRRLSSLPAKVEVVIKPFKKRRRQVLERYAVTLEKDVFNLTDITEEDARELSDIEIAQKRLASSYNADGSKKTGTALEIAVALTEYNNKITEMYDESVFQKEEYDKAWARAIRQGKGEEFVNKNTFVAISPKFWKDLSDAFGNAPQDDVSQEIKDLLKRYKQGDRLLYEDMTEEVAILLKNLYDSRTMNELRNKDWFFENVSFVERPEYQKKKAEMDNAFNTGAITAAEYDRWFAANHKEKEDAEGTYFVPASFWMKMEPLSGDYWETRYAKHWYRSQVKPEFSNVPTGEEKVGGLRDKWLNPQYAAMQNRNDVVREMYDYLTNRLEQDDKPLYNDYRLIREDEAGNKYYKLPQVIKSADTQIVAEDGVGGFVRNKVNRIRAAFAGNKEDSTEFGGDVLEQLYSESNQHLLIQADEQGRERHRVPVNLRAQINADEQNYDLMSIMMMNHHMSLNFINKQEIVADLELMRDALEEREVVETGSTFAKGAKSKVNAVFNTFGFGKTPLVTEGAASNAAAAFQSMLEARAYGIKSTGNVTVQQITNVLVRYTGATALALNAFSAGSNLISGRLQTYILSAGSQFIDARDIGFARLELAKQQAKGEFFRDLTSLTPVSKIGKLVERLNPRSEWQPLANKFAVNTGLTRLYENVDMNALTAAGEYVIQSSMMLAMLNQARALNSAGQYIDRDGNVVANADQAASLFDMYNQNDRVISADSKVQGFEIKEQKVVSSDWEFKLGFMIKELNKSIQGDYDNQSISEARRQWWGKLVLLLRRWYPATLIRRTRGLDSVRKNAAALDESDLYYNRATNAIEEGYYTSFIRYMGDVLREGKRIRMEENKWAGRAILEAFGKEKASTRLTYEKAGIYQTYAEIGLTFGYFGLAVLLTALGKAIDKKDKQAKASVYMMAFWILRAQRELTGFYNPNEILRTINTPTVVLKQVQQMVEVIFALSAEVTHQFTDPFTLREYKNGRRKGDSKLWKEISDVVPILKQIDKQVEEQLSYMTNVKGFRQ
jgi:hypothetical protein